MNEAWFNFQKLLGHLVMPAGLLWLALAVFALRALRRGDRRTACWTLATWLLYTLTGNPVVGHVLHGWLEEDYVDLRPMDEPPFDAVFVLGGCTSRSATGEVHANDAGDRIVLAARMYHAKKAAVIVCSGPPQPDGGSLPKDEVRLLAGLAVPKSAVIEVLGPRTTSEEVAAYADLIHTKPWRRMGLITSASHMRRAQGLCAKHALSLRPLPANPSGRWGGASSLWIVPNRGGFDSVETACWEIVGCCFGR